MKKHVAVTEVITFLYVVEAEQDHEAIEVALAQHIEDNAAAIGVEVSERSAQVVEGA